MDTDRFWIHCEGNSRGAKVPVVTRILGCQFETVVYAVRGRKQKCPSTAMITCRQGWNPTKVLPISEAMVVGSYLATELLAEFGRDCFRQQPVKFYFYAYNKES